VKLRNAVPLTVCGLLLAASPAFAQRANGPYSGLFGGQPDQNRTQGLDLRGSMFGAWDENIFPATEPTTQLDTRLRDSGASIGASGSLDYSLRGDRAQFALKGGADGRKYFSSPDLVTAYFAGTTVATNLTRRVTMNAGGSAAYSPFFQFAPFLDAGIANVGPLIGGFGYAALAERNLGLDASVGLADNLTSRTYLYVTASGRDWQLLDDPQFNLRSWNVGAGIHHNLTRNLGVRAGYGRGETQYVNSGQAPYGNETIDAGIDYGQTLAFARRTSFSFSTSTEIVRYVGESHFRLGGSAKLTRGFRRSWSTWIGYDRSTQYRIGFRAPLLTDSADAGVGGLATSRIKLSAGAGYTHGTIGFDGTDFSTYSGSTRADIALTRRLALFGQYAYYHYEVPPASSVLALVPRFSRQVVTVGLSVWVPLINDVRAPKRPD
jgi:hypothetical protein